MKLLLLSDTHGKLDKAIEVYHHLENINMILHCGDVLDDAEALMAELDVPVASVAGNCDYPDLPAKTIVNTPAGKILLTHGHRENVSYDLTKLLYLTESEDCVCGCFGHTHVPFHEDYDGIQLINPGSLSRPRDGSNGSFAVLDCTADGISAEIIYYDQFMSKPETPKSKKKVTGGYLRGLLNYSDRF